MVFPLQKLVELQSKVIRILLDRIVEEINPRRHVSGALAAARRNLILNLADHLCRLAPTFLPVKGFIFNAAFTGPFGGVIVNTPPMMIAKISVITAR